LTFLLLAYKEQEQRAGTKSKNKEQEQRARTESMNKKSRNKEAK